MIKTAYQLQDFYTLIDSFASSTSSSTAYICDDELQERIRQIDSQVTPIIVERQQQNREEHHYHHHHHNGSSNRSHHRGGNNGSKRSPNKRRKQETTQNWEEVRTVFKTTVIEKSNTEGVEKWIQDIRSCINKLSTKNYENQRDKILEYVEKCNQDKDETNKISENLKKVANFIFSVASTNKFYVDLYANLYVELIAKYEIFQELLYQFLSTYVNDSKDIQYVDANENYEKYCQYNKQNDMRKATAIFIVRLVQQKTIPVLRLLNIMVSFQELSNELIDTEGRENEVHEIAEIMYLFIQEGKNVFDDCKGEWIWKFVIVPFITTMSKHTKGSKKSLASRTIFKYMDIVDGGIPSP